MKSKILGILCILMLVVVFVPQTNAHAASVTKSNWYKTVLNSQSGSYKIGSKTYKRSKYKYYKLIDINKDGTKELLLSQSSSPRITCDHSVLLLTYYNKKIRAIKAFHSAGGGELLYRGTTKTITHYTRGSDLGQIEVYQLKSGALKKIVKISNLRQEDYTWQAYKNGKKCSRNTLYDYWEKYDDKATSLKYKKIS
jgi:hypothetical protein